MHYEWDERKRLGNIEKHRIDFYRAMLVFESNHFTVELLHAGEQRWRTTGMVDGRFITVVWTRRDGNTRLISARGARDNERREYRFLYGGGSSSEDC